MKLPKRFPESGFYYHYKHDPKGAVNNNAYEFLSVGFHTEDNSRPEEEHFINYRPLYENAPVYQAALQLGIPCVDNRPLEMWMGNAIKNSNMVARYTKITDPSIIAKLQAIKKQMYGE